MTYITQGNYTQQAVTGMVDNSEDRRAAVEGLMASVGARLIGYYVTTGQYDFLVITEGANVTDMMAGLMIAGSTGGVCNLKTVEAIGTTEAKAAMEKAKTARAGFKAAGGAN